MNSNFESFGSYVFLKKLAAGGMAEVFLARPATSSGNGRIQVIKRLLPHVSKNSMFLNMFQTEIQVILGFNHPHLVQLHDFGEFDQRPYIVMEYLEGKNLKEVISKFSKRKQQLPVPMVLSLIAQAASGLNYAHTFINKVTGEAVNAIHRDISPHNLMISYEGNLKVIDFGIAKAASNITHEETQVGTVKGKISYLSPEQTKGSAYVDARSDIFSLGIVAWELLTLQRPFTKDGDTEISIISKINNCEEYIVPPSTYNPQIPPELDAVILKALRKDPNDRYASANEFHTQIRKVLVNAFPHYSYSDTARLMSIHFAEEIRHEREELQNLNYQVQDSINTKVDSQTMVIANVAEVAPIQSKAQLEVTTSYNNVDERLLKIEGLIQQKATRRHYLMLAFYVLSIVIVKLDYQYGFMKILFSAKEAQSAVLSSKAPAKAKLKTANIKKIRRSKNL